MPRKAGNRQAGEKKDPRRGGRRRNSNRASSQIERRPPKSANPKTSKRAGQRAALDLPLDNRRVTRSQSKKLSLERFRANIEADIIPTAIERRGKERDAPGTSLLNSRQQQTSHVSQRLSAWLESLKPIPAEGARSDRQTDSNSMDTLEISMESFTSASSSSRLLSDNASTIKARRKTKGDIVEKLRTRRAQPSRPTPDEKKPGFVSDFGISQSIAIPFQNTKELQRIMRSFLTKAQKAKAGEDSYAAIEQLSNDFNKWKSSVQLATVTKQEFQSDIEHCKDSNEAVFQRTVLMSIIDRWQLTDKFGFNCEGHWSLQGKHFPLPSTQGPGDKISGPKPDLAIFFKFNSLLGGSDEASPIPPDLYACLRPDGSKSRCFPFMFIEAKKGGHELSSAHNANMHSASQALFNIFTWMARAGETDVFFSDVRLFSIAINAERAMVCVHRAKPLEGGDGLVYLFDELGTFTDYKRDEICALIRSILLKYGEEKLFGILQKTFRQVSMDYQQKQKRKSDAAPGAPAKRTRTSQAADRRASQGSLDSSTSFGASRITLSG